MTKRELGSICGSVLVLEKDVCLGESVVVISFFGGSINGVVDLP